ncbi:hypothetical protein FRB93_006788 [Tulasnella sp. JGI-2019a]|nr:hypothetical protein FRB93_006788 [Tulasnella sp. JGI-2019a]
MLSVLIGCHVAYLFADLQAATLRRNRRKGLLFIGIFLLLHTAFLEAALVCLVIAVLGAVWGGSNTIAKAGTIIAAAVTFLIMVVWVFLGPTIFGSDTEDENENECTRK